MAASRSCLRRQRLAPIILTVFFTQVPSATGVPTRYIHDLPNASRLRFGTDFKEVFEKPSQVFNELSGQVGTFESTLEDMQREKLSDITQQKLDYERRLDEQRRENVQIANRNRRISSNIASMRRNCARKRSRIQDLENGNNDLRQNFLQLVSNLTTAGEFTANTLTEERDSSEVSVLAAFAGFGHPKIVRGRKAMRSSGRPSSLQRRSRDVEDDKAGEEGEEEVQHQQDDKAGEEEDEEEEEEEEEEWFESDGKSAERWHAHDEEDRDDGAAWADASHDDWEPEMTSADDSLEEDRDDQEEEYDGLEKIEGRSELTARSQDDGGPLRRPGAARRPQKIEALRGTIMDVSDAESAEDDSLLMQSPESALMFLQLGQDPSTERVGMPDPAVMAMGDDTSIELPDTMGMLKDLNNNLDSLNKVHMDSAKSLHAMFLQHNAHGLKLMQGLNAEQRKLNTTADQFSALMPRLSAAEKHLNTKRRYLASQLQSLRAFLIVVGNSEIAELKEDQAKSDRVSRGHEGTILLQVPSGPVTTTDASGHLPELSDVLVDSFDSYRALDTKVGELGENLDDMTQKASAALQDTQLGYEDTLQAQTRDTLRMAKLNTNLASDLQNSKKDNQKLQERARRTRAENNFIRSDLRRVKGNITVAIAFAKNTLARASDSNATELKVIQELRHQDEVNAAKEAEQHRFDEIASQWDIFSKLPADDGVVLLEVDHEVHNATSGKMSHTRPPYMSVLEFAATAAKRHAELQTNKGLKRKPKGKMAMPRKPPVKEQAWSAFVHGKGAEAVGQQETPVASRTAGRKGGNVHAEATNHVPARLGPKALLRDMEANLKKMREAQHASKDTLKGIFAEVFYHGQHRLEALKKERDILTRSLAQTQGLTPKLQLALDRMTSINRNLRNNDLSVKMFLSRLGRSCEAQTTVEAEELTAFISPVALVRTGGSPSLLQMTSRLERRTHSSSAAATQTASERALDGEDGEEGEGASDPHSNTYAAVSSKAKSLQKKLTEIERDHQHKLADNSVEYSRRLALVDSKTHNLRKDAHDLDIEIREILTQSQHLRNQATKLKEDRARLVADLDAISKNLTTAAEFAMHTVRDMSASDAQEAPELQVLAELSKLDEIKATNDNKLTRLGQIASATKSSDMLLLQTAAGDNPKALLSVLEGGLEDLAKEQDAKVKEAHAQFTKTIKKKYDEYKQEVERMNSLKAKRANALELKARLEKAVKVLEEQCSLLQSRAKSLRSFAGRLSARPEPKTASHDTSDEDDSNAASVKQDRNASTATAMKPTAFVQKQIIGAISKEAHMEAWIGRFLR